MQKETTRQTADRLWRRRYTRAWIGLAVYAIAAFLPGTKGVVPIFAQAVFFAAYFALVLWPVYVSFQADQRPAIRDGRNRCR